MEKKVNMEDLLKYPTEVLEEAARVLRQRKREPTCGDPLVAEQREPQSI